MSDDPIKIGQPIAYPNANGTRILRYTVEISHEGLNEHKLVSAPELEMLDNKMKLQVRKWSEKWNKVKLKNSYIKQADWRTVEARKALQKIDDLLISALSKEHKVNFETLKEKAPYPLPLPVKPSVRKKEYPRKPEKYSDEFRPVFTLSEKIHIAEREQKVRKYEDKYYKAMLEWEEEKRVVDNYNRQSHIDLDKWNASVAEWEKRKNTYLKQQEERNAKIDRFRESYLRRDSESIFRYCELVLKNSEYPDAFPKCFELEYKEENKIVIIEYELPSIECLPKTLEYKYSAAKNELIECIIPENQINKMYDETLYKIALRTIHELFEADASDAIEAISFNGWVTAINKATGKMENNCILSLQVKKTEFIGIDLSKVDAKTCFKNLKGVASSKLCSLTPIKPILQISREDRRFIESYAVADKIDDATNVAAMDWEDFEHLIRELFEKEFQAGGGDVKVTQASRDGGVDAIAFDPDPIRGGKIVIQAKRYTNTVSVSAVRDLYGTVLNEGATKGILVSTADYGPDAYEFAKGKPLTLLNGSNLLHLLEKHGHHAKIDLKEAKMILAEKER